MQKTKHLHKKTELQKPIRWRKLTQVDSASFLEGRELIKMGWSQPAMDIYETEKEVVARFDMPGVTEEDIEMTFDGNTLRVRAEKKAELEHEKRRGNIERTSKGFFRIAWLPKKIMTEDAVRTFANGVLEVRIPKSHPASAEKINLLQGELY